MAKGAAGLRGIPVSLDSMKTAKFALLTGRDALSRVLEGIEAGRAAGCRTILVTTGVRQASYADIAEWQVQPDFVVPDLLTAAEMILSLERKMN